MDEPANHMGLPGIQCLEGVQRGCGGGWPEGILWDNIYDNIPTICL